MYQARVYGDLREAGSLFLWSDHFKSHHDQCYQAKPRLHMKRKKERAGESAWLRKRRRLVSNQRRWLILRELLLTSSRRCQKSPGAYGLKSKQKRCGFKSKEHMKADSRMHHWLLWWALSIVLILLAALRNGSNESWSIAAKDQHWEETSQWVLEGEKGKTRHLFQEPWERSPGHQENLGSIGCKYCWMKVTWLNICFLRTCQHGSNRQSILCWISPGRSLAQDYWPFPWISSLGIISLPNF